MEAFHEKKTVKRDQLTFPVAVWKNGIDLADILTMGNNVYDNDLLSRVLKCLIVIKESNEEHY